jgi:hypothetical protein
MDIGKRVWDDAGGNLVAGRADLPDMTGSITHSVHSPLEKPLVFDRKIDGFSLTIAALFVVFNDHDHTSVSHYRRHFVGSSHPKQQG